MNITSPIYIHVDGRGARVKQSILEAEAMLDALAKFAREETTAATLSGIEKSLNEARALLAK